MDITVMRLELLIDLPHFFLSLFNFETFSMHVHKKKKKKKKRERI